MMSRLCVIGAGTFAIIFRIQVDFIINVALQQSCNLFVQSDRPFVWITFPDIAIRCFQQIFHLLLNVSCSLQIFIAQISSSLPKIACEWTNMLLLFHLLICKIRDQSYRVRKQCRTCMTVAPKHTLSVRPRKCHGNTRIFVDLQI